MFENVLVVDDGRESGSDAYRQAAALAASVGKASPIAVCLVADPRLQRYVEAEHVSLVAVGVRGHGHLSETFSGGVAGRLLRDAPCSVLIARPSPAPMRFPRAIAVGIDSSPEGGAALATAQYLAERLDTRLRIITAAHDEQALERARLHTPFVDAVFGRPVDALVEAGDAADLVIVGSRGVRGFQRLASVSARVAQRSSSSVLVVRGWR